MQNGKGGTRQRRFSTQFKPSANPSTKFWMKKPNVNHNLDEKEKEAKIWMKKPKLDENRRNFYFTFIMWMNVEILKQI
jgi:hypothetical protein